MRGVNGTRDGTRRKPRTGNPAPQVKIGRYQIKIRWVQKVAPSCIRTYTKLKGLSRSLRTAFADLKLQHLWIVYPGERRYALAERVEAIPLADLADALATSGV